MDKGSDAGGWGGVGGGSVGRGCMGGGSEDGGSEDGGSMGGGSEDGGSALGTAQSATRARALAAADCASGLARLPDCSPAPYGSLSAACLRLGSLMCCAVSALSTLPFLVLRFAPIRAAVSGQES